MTSAQSLKLLIPFLRMDFYDANLMYWCVRPCTDLLYAVGAFTEAESKGKEIM